MAVAYDSETASVVVDMEHDHTRSEGPLYVKGGEDLVALVNEEVRRAVDIGALVVYTQDWHPFRTPHFVCAICHAVTSKSFGTLS